MYELQTPLNLVFIHLFNKYLWTTYFVSAINFWPPPVWPSPAKLEKLKLDSGAEEIIDDSGHLLGEIFLLTQVTYSSRVSWGSALLSSFRLQELSLVAQEKESWHIM